ncbi:MAG: thiamine biosynthesis protein ThiH [Bacteroidetes bacterium GWA2_31_9]|nr:MAG: thiamine biosynthesis protein ThiH [Bacteroidetes bacterium GWA2_31_9]
MLFSEIIKKYNWSEITDQIYSKTTNDVEIALAKNNINIEDFKALISPAASPFLEIMAQKSHLRTVQRFGKVMQLYIPLYLSNECTNHCTYCGFNHENDIKRKTLSIDEVLNEVKVIKSYGYEHVLLVTGESPKRAGLAYLKEVIKAIKPFFSLISIEIQPLEQHEYSELYELGLNTVYVYQETYNKVNYPIYHPKGKKSDYDYRIDTPERIGEASIHRIGIGALLGLEDWRTESFFVATHLNFLKKKFWKSKFSISFPRLRPHAGSFQPNVIMSDKELVQLITSYRLLDEFIELSVSVRESKKFRDNIIKLGITSISAGSKTEPGGYSNNMSELEQFEVHDNRTPNEFAKIIRLQGYEPVWKDWGEYMQKNNF